MREEVIKILHEIKEQCQIIMDDRRMRENSWIMAKLGISNILELCDLAEERIKNDP